MDEATARLHQMLQDIRQVLTLSNTQSCSILRMNIGFEKKEERYQRYSVHENGELERFTSDDGTMVYAIGSVTNLLIAVALHLIMDDYRTSGKPQHANYTRVRSWNQTYTDAFNDCSPFNPMEPLPGNPTLQHLLAHFKGLPHVARILLAPDGTQLMSKDTFIKIAPRLGMFCGRETIDAPWLEYSNGNYVLIGILIEAVSNMPLGEFLKSEVLEPLKMSRTYVDTETLQRAAPPLRAEPFLVINVTGGKTRKLIPDRVFKSDAISIASLGIYSCVRDIGRLYETLMAPTIPNYKPYMLLSKESIYRLFGFTMNSRRPYMIQHRDEQWAGVGLITNTNSLRVGSRSINRLVLPKDKASAFKLGTNPNEPDIELMYQAGSVSTFSCSAYLITLYNDLFVVMSNTLGQGDAADYISRIMMQNRYDLKTHRLSKYPSAGSRINIVKKARRGTHRFAQRWMKFYATNEINDNHATVDNEKLIGLYSNEDFLQSLAVSEKDGKLYVEIIGDAERSEKLPLVVIEPGKLRICPKHPSIDFFDFWKNMELYYDSSAKTKKIPTLWTTIILGEKEGNLRYELQSET